MHCLIKWLNPHLSLLYNSALPIITCPEFQCCNLSNRKHINKDFALHFKGLICILNRPLKPPSGQRFIFFIYFFNYCFSWSFIRSIRSSHYLWIIKCDLYHSHTYIVPLIVCNFPHEQPTSEKAKSSHRFQISFIIIQLIDWSDLFCNIIVLCAYTCLFLVPHLTLTCAVLCWHKEQWSMPLKVNNAIQQHNLQCKWR